VALVTPVRYVPLNNKNMSLVGQGMDFPSNSKDMSLVGLVRAFNSKSNIAVLGR
jgi:hypothetical protein